MTSRIARWIRRTLSTFSYYDFVLFAVPVVLLAGLVATTTFSIPSPHRSNSSRHRVGVRLGRRDVQPTT
ncbi:hypothetical protein [Haladaptatus sp. NG-SE-30]